jgi:hypothetical protein
MAFRLVIVCGLIALASARAETIPESETAQPPTPARINAVLAAARRDGWAPQAAALRAAALRSYAHANVFTADSWYQLCAWSMLWGESEVDFTSRWVAAVNALKVGHANMSQDVPMRMVPIGAALSPDVQAWLLGNRAFSEEFFAHLQPVDYLPKVFEILDTIFRTAPTEFKAYPNLALAIALVYDVPPPPTWPHGQVTPAALPRKLPAAVDAFKWWAHQDELGRTYQSLKRLPADELKFVVDAAAPAAELEWAQKTITVPLGEMPQVYAMIHYRVERVAKNQAIWPERTYRLADILASGGICSDQAYFATEVAKARGVPCLLFGGGGNDARHAWFGYLDGEQRWQLDAGRYAEQRFVTGVAFDPQTWGTISDHELQFLTEHFRALPSYRQSRIHEEFATLMLALQDPAGAVAAARKAVQFEPRHQQAWDTLVTATLEKTHDPRAAEAVLREAALAFQRRYPDLEAMYVGRVVASLRARGQTSEAEATVRDLAQKYQSDRVDISVQQARDIVLRSIASDPLEQQVRTYNSIVDSYGAGAGIAFFDQVVRLFVEHLWQLQHAPEALRALEHAREVMQPPAQSQLETELNKLQETVSVRKKV